MGACPLWMLKAQDKAVGHQKSSGIRFPATKGPSRLVGEPEPCNRGPLGEATRRPCTRWVHAWVTKAAVHLLLYLHFVRLGFFSPRAFPFRIKPKGSAASRDVAFPITTPRHSFCRNRPAVRQGALTPLARRPRSAGATGSTVPPSTGTYGAHRRFLASPGCKSRLR